MAARPRFAATVRDADAANDEIVRTRIMGVNSNENYSHQNY
jgi:hypothetical protein